MASKIKIPKKLNRIVGIDISENNLVATELQFVKNGINISSGFSLRTPVFQDVNKTINFINQNLRAMNVKAKDCAFGFSMQYFKMLPVPIPEAMPEEDIGAIILQEGNIDFANEVLSWIPLRNTRRQDVDGVIKYDVLGIAIQRTLVDFVRLVSQRCKLKACSLSPSFLSLGAFLPQKLENNLVATLWISQIRSELVVWSGQEPIYEHLFLTHQINEQVFQSLNYIQSQLSGAQISTIFVSGPFVKETNLSQIPYNIQQFSLPQFFFDGGNVFQQMNISEIISALGVAWTSSNDILYPIPNLLGPTRARAEGMQGIFKDKISASPKLEINLPFSSGLKNLDPHFARFVYASIFVIAISVIGGLLIQNLLLPGVVAQESSVTSRINISQAHVNRLLSIEKTNKVLVLKSDFFSELIDKRKPWSKILRELGDMTPKGMWIDRLEIKSNNIDVFGRALNVDAVANFSINLNYTSKLLGKAQIIALRKFEEEGTDIIEFQVTTQVKDLSQGIVNDNQTAASKIPSKT